MSAIDFTELSRRNKAYGGANGKKISVIYEGEQYMLKFPHPAKRNEDMSYTNSCFSEYLGCQIFNSIGIPVQKTLLGTFMVNGDKKIVVACQDFTKPGLVLQDFASLKNQIIDSRRSGYGTELDDILHTFAEQTSLDQASLVKWFWNMFIVDAFIGNWDRHNGNWGFLYNTVTDEISFAPMYDCGNSLYPQADDKIMEAVLVDEKERDYRIFEIPTSAIEIKKTRIKYFDFLTSTKNKDCISALMNITPKINMADIQKIIEDAPFISDLQKQFYFTMLVARKERILDFACNKLLQEQKRAVKQQKRRNDRDFR